MNFEFQLTNQVVFGENSIDRLGELAKSLQANSVLVVTDPGIVAAGHVERAIASLKKESLEYHVFHEVEENPTTKHVENGVRFAKSFPKLDLIIGLGGGSSMDCGKGINFLYSNENKAKLFVFLFTRTDKKSEHDLTITPKFLKETLKIYPRAD